MRIDPFWKNKTVLVTGGTSGLGRILAETFGRAGCRVAVVGLEPELTRLMAAQLAESGIESLGISADVTKQADVDRAVAETVSRFGRLDVLVNGAGRTDRGWIMQTDPDAILRLFELNTLGAIRFTQAALPYLLETRGHVVNIGSLAAKSAARWVGGYPVTKFALAAFSQQLRLEMGPEGLHVLLVCPGPVKRTDERLYPLSQKESTATDGPALPPRPAEVDAQDRISLLPRPTEAAPKVRVSWEGKEIPLDAPRPAEADGQTRTSLLPRPTEAAHKARISWEQKEVPESALAPGGGVKVGKIDPNRLAENILVCCKKRRPELVVPAYARLLFALSALSPWLGDWVVRKKT